MPADRSAAGAPMLWAIVVLGVAAAAAPARAGGIVEDAQSFVEFIEDDEANCVMREGRMILVRNRHASRPLRVWLERYHMGRLTGDRSRSDLAPGAEAEKLGCSRTDFGPQEWRVLRAQFVEQ